MPDGKGKNLNSSNVLDKLHVIISIAASIVATLLSLVQQITLHQLALRLIIVIIAFYLIGLAAKIYLLRFVFVPPPTEEDPGESQGTADQPDGGDTEPDMGQLAPANPLGAGQFATGVPGMQNFGMPPLEVPSKYDT